MYIVNYTQVTCCNQVQDASARCSTRASIISQSPAKTAQSKPVMPCCSCARTYIHDATGRYSINIHAF